MSHDVSPKRTRELQRFGRSVAGATAVGPEERIDTNILGAAARDEIGALARAQEYTSYLPTLGSKLSHELRTPRTIVSSSVDNLADAPRDAEARTYPDCARHGSARLRALLTSLSEATRVEQVIEEAERVNFDLADLVRSMDQAYRQRLTTRRIEVQTPSHACRLTGAPELIAQLLDKLMDNAVDFTPADGRVGLLLAAENDEYVEYVLSVANERRSDVTG
jgi:signal transduction histidine kinase